MEIESGIHQLTYGREPFSGFPPPNSFLVTGKDASILVDAGYDSEEDHISRMTYIQDAHVPEVVGLVITHRHPDHAGGAASLSIDAGAPINCHPLERMAIESEHLAGRATIERELVGGEKWDLGGLSVEIYHGPGHTPGCLALYLPELGALITADTVLGISTTVLRPEEGDLRQYVSTLELFLEIGAKTIYTGHGPPVLKPAERIRRLISHRERREHELISALIFPRTVTELRERLYSDLIPIRWNLAEAQLQTGLNKLQADGVVVMDRDRYLLA